MRPIIYLPLVILVFLGGLWTGQHLGSPNEAPALLQENGVTKGTSQESNQDRAGVLPSPSPRLARSPDLASGRETLAAGKVTDQLPRPGEQPQTVPKLPPGVNLTRENLDETAASLRLSGMPEEDVQGLLEGPRSRLASGEGGPFPTLQDLPPEERVAEIKNNLKDSGIPPEDLEALAGGLSQRIESLKQAPGRMSPWMAPNTSK